MKGEMEARASRVMRSFAILIALLFAGCSDPSKELLRDALKSYPEFWTKPEQIAYLRQLHTVPEDYRFVRMELVGSAAAEKRNYGLYEWSFRFLKASDDMIEIRQICYYDSDSVVMHDVKQERLHWHGADLVQRKFFFRGVEE